MLIKSTSSFVIALFIGLMVSPSHSGDMISCDGFESCPAESAWSCIDAACIAIPAPPTLDFTTPSSPSRDANPTVHGTAEPGTTVNLWTTSACEAAPAGSGTADGAGGFAIQITVDTGSTTEFSATATDDAGISSICTAGLTFVHIAPIGPMRITNLTTHTVEPKTLIRWPVAMDGELYFSTNDRFDGWSLWRSDGTTDGTVLVRAFSGGGEQGLSSLTVVGDVLFFAAWDPNHGSELWRSDGTAAGTSLVYDVRAGHEGSSPHKLIPFGDQLLFIADDVNGRALWTTDGTQIGTKRRVGGIKARYADNFFLFDGTLYMSTTDSESTSNFELAALETSTGWSIDFVKDINTSGSSHPNGFIPLNDTSFLFAADDGTNGSELWISDGTESRTTRVTNINPTGHASPQGMTRVGRRIIFQANDGTNGAELWSTDGTTEGTFIVSDIHPTGSSIPHNLVEVGGTLFFTAYNPVNGSEPWQSDGTPEGTALLRDIAPDSGSSGPDELIDVNGTLYFVADDGSHGEELWVSDGTTEGTVMARDINPIGDSSPSYLTAVGHTLFFEADDGRFPRRLWKSNGNARSTTLASDPGGIPFGSNANQLTEVGSDIYFQAHDETHGSELWKMDSNTMNATFVADIAAGSTSSFPRHFTALGNALIFTANDGNIGYELWKSDATGTSVLMDVNPSGSSQPSGLTPAIGAIYFLANSGELWRTNGTTIGTSFVYRPDFSTPYEIIAVGDSLFFTTIGTFIGEGLYAHDGTTTTIVAPLLYGVSAMADIGGLLMLAAADANVAFKDVELWKSDGTVDGTVLVSDINIGTEPSSPADLTLLGDSVIFSADDGVVGRELWISDGTGAGTSLLADVRPGPVGSNPSGITVVGPNAYFVAGNGTLGTELWVTDGTAVGTTLVRDCASGVESSYPQQITEVGGFLLFIAFTVEHGTELWQSDGTAAGTHLVADLHPGPRSSKPLHLLSTGGALYFSADEPSEGREIWFYRP